MEKLINLPIYLDYNATSPMAHSVKDWLAVGDVSFANPASLHRLGQRSRKLIKDSTDYFYKKWLPNRKHNLFYHSGATEGINTVFKGFVKKVLSDKKIPYLFHSSVDHAAVHESCLYCEQEWNVKRHVFSVNEEGELLEEDLIEQIKEIQRKDPFAQVLVNFTHVHNETGVIWPFEQALRIKKETGAFIHLDVVQTVGKVEPFAYLPEELDSYTFSGHKFGSLKGIGMTFFKPTFPFSPFLLGGGQQKGYRSGTENLTGIYSMKLALQEIESQYSYKELLQCRLSLEDFLLNLLRDKGGIIAYGAKNRNANTVNFYIKGKNASLITTAMDIAGLAVGSGSACSSGQVKENRILKAMGHKELAQLGTVRLSMSPLIKLEEVKEIENLLAPVLQRFL